MSIRLSVSLPVTFTTVVLASFLLGIIPVLMFSLDLISDTTEELVLSISKTIRSEISAFFAVPVESTGTLSRVMSRDISSDETMKMLLLDVVSHSRVIVYAQVGDESGLFFGAERKGNFSTGYRYWLHIRDLSTNMIKTTYETEPKSLTKGAVVYTEDDFNTTSRPWFTNATEQGTWTDPYWYTDGSAIGITATTKTSPSGVFAVDVSTDSVSAFLKGLSYGETTHGVGLLLSGSTYDVLAVSWPEAVYKKQSEGVFSFKKLIEFEQHKNLLTSLSDSVVRDAKVGSFLIKRVNGNVIGTSRIIDSFGINIVTVVVIPASDISGELVGSLRRIIVLVSCAFGIFVGISIIISTYVSSQITELSSCMTTAANLNYDIKRKTGKFIEVAELASMWKSFIFLLGNVKHLNSFLPRSVLDEIKPTRPSWHSDNILSAFIDGEGEGGAAGGGFEKCFNSVPEDDSSLICSQSDPFSTSIGLIGLRFIPRVGILNARAEWKSTDVEMSFALLTDWICGITDDIKLTIGTLETARGDSMLISFGAMGNPWHIPSRLCRSIISIKQRGYDAAEVIGGGITDLNFRISIGASLGEVQAGVVSSAPGTGHSHRVRCVIGEPVKMAMTLCSTCDLYFVSNLISSTVVGPSAPASEECVVRPVANCRLLDEEISQTIYTLCEMSEKEDTVRDAWEALSSDNGLHKCIGILQEYCLAHPTDRMAKDMLDTIQIHGEVHDLVSLTAVPVTAHTERLIQSTKLKNDIITSHFTTYLTLQTEGKAGQEINILKDRIRRFQSSVIETGGVVESTDGGLFVARWAGVKQATVRRTLSCAIKLAKNATDSKLKFGIGIASATSVHGMLVWEEGMVHAVMGNSRSIAEALSGMALSEGIRILTEGEFPEMAPTRVWQHLLDRVFIQTPNDYALLTRGVSQLCYESPPQPLYEEALTAVSSGNWQMAETKLQDLVNYLALKDNGPNTEDIQKRGILMWYKKVLSAVGIVRRDPLVENLIAVITRGGAVFQGMPFCPFDLLIVSGDCSNRNLLIDTTHEGEVLDVSALLNRESVQHHIWGNFSRATALHFAQKRFISMSPRALSPRRAAAMQRHSTFSVDLFTQESNDLSPMEPSTLLFHRMHAFFRMFVVLYFTTEIPLKSVYSPTPLPFDDEQFYFSWMAFDYVIELVLWSELAYRFYISQMYRTAILRSKLFTVEIAALIPHEWIWISLSQDSTFFYVFRMNRVLYIFLFPYTFERISELIFRGREVAAVFMKFLLSLLCVLCWLSCMFGALVFRAQDSKTASLYMGMDDITEAAPEYQALHGFHWTLRGFAGFGTRLPTTDVEVCACLVTASLGIFIFATVIAYMQRLLLLLGSNEKELAKRVDQLVSFASHTGILELQRSQEEEQFLHSPHEKVKSDIISDCIVYYRTMYERTKQVFPGQYDFVISELPDQIAREVEYFANSSVVSKFPELQLTNDPEFVTRIVSTMKPYFICKGECIVQRRAIEDMLGQCPGLYFFLSGSAVVHMSEKPRGTLYWESIRRGTEDEDTAKVIEWLGPGSYWGELNLIHDCCGHPATVELLDHTEVYCLSAESFKALEQFPACLQPFYHTACVRNSLISGTHKVPLKSPLPKYTALARIGNTILSQQQIGKALLNCIRERRSSIGNGRGERKFLECDFFGSDSGAQSTRVQTEISSPKDDPDNIPNSNIIMSE